MSAHPLSFTQKLELAKEVQAWIEDAGKKLQEMEPNIRVADGPFSTISALDALGYRIEKPVWPKNPHFGYEDSY